MQVTLQSRLGPIYSVRGSVGDQRRRPGDCGTPVSNRLDLGPPLRLPGAPVSQSSCGTLHVGCLVSQELRSNGGYLAASKLVSTFTSSYAIGRYRDLEIPLPSNGPAVQLEWRSTTLQLSISRLELGASALISSFPVGLAALLPASTCRSAHVNFSRFVTTSRNGTHRTTLVQWTSYDTKPR